jgi:hypothetical protein
VNTEVSSCSTTQPSSAPTAMADQRVPRFVTQGRSEIASTHTTTSSRVVMLRM